MGGRDVTAYRVLPGAGREGDGVMREGLGHERRRLVGSMRRALSAGGRAVSEVGVVVLRPAPLGCLSGPCVLPAPSRAMAASAPAGNVRAEQSEKGKWECKVLSFANEGAEVPTTF